jgi:hypothetical protein
MTKMQAQQRAKLISDAKIKREAAKAARLADKEGVIVPDFDPKLVH